MRFCDSHWKELKEAIHARGLGHLIAEGGADLKAKLTAKTFEPLIAAHNGLVEIALGVFGLALMQGEKCPVCELKTYDYIAFAADGVKGAHEELQRKDAVPGPSIVQ